jgi:hypothetical protein
MPRGQRKRGQYQLTIWWPDGSRSGRFTDKNLSVDDFGEALRDDLEEMLRRLANVQAESRARRTALKEV